MKCEHCGKEHDGTFGSGRFCSRKCANTRQYSEESKKKTSDTLKVFYKTHRSPAYKKKKSLDSLEKQRESLLKNWKARHDYIKENTPFEKWSIRLRKSYIFNKFGNTCQECGHSYTNERGKGPFEIHHIDGNNKNNKEENLTILCLNCHWKTGNWRFRGRKHTRKTKRIISEKIKKIRNSRVA